jgi:hypothetical protein
MWDDNPRDIRQALHDMQERYNQLATRVNHLTAAEMQAQQRVQINAIKEIVTHTYSRAAAYTNLILVAGYVAFFTVWTTMKPDLNKALALSSGLLVLISVLLFVFSEIYKMYTGTLYFAKLQKELAQKPSPTLVQDIEAAEQEFNARALRVWRIVFIPTVLLGCSGGILLAVAFGYGLIAELIRICLGR